MAAVNSLCPELSAGSNSYVTTAHAMKTCSECAYKIRRTEPADSEFGLPAFDGRKYPDACPKCRTAL